MASSELVIVIIGVDRCGDLLAHAAAFTKKVILDTNELVTVVPTFHFRDALFMEMKPSAQLLLLGQCPN